ncbi:MAG: hypothetical protein WA667_18795 [Candidatus Nitrosopolaris sp.]
MVGGTHPAYVTNEGSYKYGFKVGFSDYQCASTDFDCDSPYNDNAIHRCYIGANDTGWPTPPYAQGLVVTNVTACIDGYVNGWKHWCNTNAKDCAFWTTKGVFPEEITTRN